MKVSGGIFSTAAAVGGGGDDDGKANESSSLHHRPCVRTSFTFKLQHNTMMMTRTKRSIECITQELDVI